MNSTDLIAILGNISNSLYPLQHLISGAAYLLGIIFFFSAILKFLKIGDSRTGSPSQEKMFSPLMHLFIGTLLICLPSSLDIAANTFFGSGNILTYSAYTSNNMSSLIGFFIRTAGILWFVRGCVLVVHSSDPGTKHAFKGMAFIAAGILSMNFDNTVSMLTTFMGDIANWTIAVKNKYGY